MPGFTYYLPAITAEKVVSGKISGGTIRPEILNAFGLGHLHDVRTAGTDAVVSVVRRDGPDGSTGTVLYIRTQKEKHTPNLNEDYSIKFDSKRQVWSPSISGQFWIGYDRDKPPTAEDLVRPSILAGRWVPDASGDKWAIPTARTDGKTYGLLPACIAFDGAGGLVSELKQPDRHIWEIACELYDRIQRDKEIEDLQMLDWVIQCMSANYRIGRTEHRVLHDVRGGITDWDFFSNFTVALLDADVTSIVNDEKKTKDSDQVANC